MADIPLRDTVPLEVIQLDSDLTYEEKQLRLLSLPAESPIVRLSSFVKFSGATTPRMKPPGSERKICWRTTLTYFLANPNLEGEIHLKGGRFVTSQIFNLECYTLDHHAYHILFCILSDPRNSTQLKDPRRELGISLFSYLGFSQILKIGSFDFIYFIFNYFYYKNMREGIKWLSQNKEILRI